MTHSCYGGFDSKRRILKPIGEVSVGSDGLVHMTITITAALNLSRYLLETTEAENEELARRVEAGEIAPPPALLRAAELHILASALGLELLQDRETNGAEREERWSPDAWSPRNFN